MEPSKKIAAGHLAALLTIFLWGTTFVSTKVLLAEFSPFEILFYRFVIGYAALFAAHRNTLGFKGWRQEGLFALAGLSGVTLYFLCENMALTFSLATNVGIIVSIAPLFTAMLAFFFLKEEKLSGQFFLGFALAIGGIALISFNGRYTLQLNPVGDILALSACVLWAIYSIVMRKIGEFGYHTIAVTRRVFFYGLVLMIPFLPFFGFRLGVERLAAPVNLFNILFLGFGASAVCFGSWNWCVKTLGAVKTSTYIYLVPVVTIIFSALILKEKITLAAVAGLGLTLCGLAVSEKRDWRKLLRR